MEKQPIKRNKHIVQLSRDHHFGLLFCWKIRQGIKMQTDLSRIRAYINYFLSQHLEHHFYEEDNLLLNKIELSLAGPAGQEHEEIRALISDINGPGKHKTELYLELTSLMETHIRYEERTLFPYIEKHLSEDELRGVGEILSSNRSGREVDRYEDEFWLLKKEHAEV